MKNQLIIFVFAFSLLLGGSVQAQDALTRVANGEDANVLYKSMALGGAFMGSEGWGLFFRKAKINTIFRKSFWELETATMHSDKEVKTQNPYYPDASSYDFGKLNGMQVFRAGLGNYKMLWRKNDLDCIEVDVVYAGGLSLAVLKPVYLQIIESTPSLNEFVLSEQKYDPNNDTPANIYGAGSAFDGLGELSFHPGVYGRLGFNFDYSGRHDMVKGIETGIEIDAYPQKIEIMAPQVASNNQFFLTYYLSISFGKRWF